MHALKLLNEVAVRVYWGLFGQLNIVSTKDVTVIYI